MVAVLENNIVEVVERFRQIEKELSSEKGAFHLFALIEREDSFGKWDVVVSASWIRDEMDALRIIAAKINSKLSENEHLLLSRIVILPTTDDFVKNLNALFGPIVNGNLQLTNIKINDIRIKDAYIITSALTYL